MIHVKLIDRFDLLFLLVLFLEDNYPRKKERNKEG